MRIATPLALVCALASAVTPALAKPTVVRLDLRVGSQQRRGDLLRLPVRRLQQHHRPHLDHHRPLPAVAQSGRGHVGGQ